MAIKALKLDAIIKYESAFDPDRGTPDATVWHLGTLDSRTSGRIKDQATKFVVDPNAPEEEVSTVVNTSEVNYQRVQYGLKGFDNFQDDAGNDVKFTTRTKRHGNVEYKIVSDEVMKQIPGAILAELAAKIDEGNELSVVQAKNSGTP